MKLTIEQARALLLDSHPRYAADCHECHERMIDLMRGSGVELPDDVEIVP